MQIKGTHNIKTSYDRNISKVIIVSKTASKALRPLKNDLWNKKRLTMLVTRWQELHTFEHIRFVRITWE